MRMNKIYPKLITTLFLILFGALLMKYADAGSSTDQSSTKKSGPMTSVSH